VVWNINTLVPLFAALIYAVVFIVVARATPLTQSRRALIGYLLAMFLWALGSFMVHSEVGNTLFWFRMMSSAGLASIIALFNFVQTELNRPRRWAEWVYLALWILIAGSLFTDLFFPSAAIVDGELTYEFSTLALIFAPPLYGLYLFGLIELASAYRRSEDRVERNRLRYLMLGTGLVIAASFVNFTPLGKFPIDIAANGVNALLIAYAIIRHELLDIRIVFRKSLSYVTLVLALALTYLAPILILELASVKFSTGLNLSGVLLALVVGVIIAGLVHWLYEDIRDRIDRIYFRERYDAYLMVQELSEQLASTLDLDAMTSILLSRLSETLHLQSIALFLKLHASGEYSLSTGIELDVDELDLRWEYDHPICRWLRVEGKVLTRRRLDILPILSGIWQRDRDVLDRLGVELLVPLRTKGELVGILAVGSKQSGEGFSQEDQAFLSTLASQVAVALENARLFMETNIRLMEQEAIFEVGTSLASAYNLDDILQLVVNHASLTDAPDSKAVIHLYDHEGKRLVPRAISTTSKEPKRVMGFRLNEGIAGRALRDQKMQYLPDVRKDPDFIGSGKEFQSLVVAPLLVEDTVEGILSVTSSKKHAFSENSLRQLNALGNQAAIAVHKAQMTERLRDSLAALELRSAELESSLAQLQSAQTQLVQAGKLASLGTLTAGIAHELNNPLAGIKLFAQNLLRFETSGLLTVEKLRQTLTKIDTLVDKAADIIEHLRAFSRQASGKLEVLIVNEPINDALSMLSEQLRLRNIQLNIDLDQNLPAVRGNSNQLEQVIVNLVTNARDALRERDEKVITLRTFVNKGFVMVEVSDTGSGIQPEHIDKIFDPFFTTKAIGEGTGLGLSISHGIVEYHGGFIEVESVVDKGSTFRLILPLARQDTKSIV
jgi:signal transduction histidine kinase